MEDPVDIRAIVVAICDALGVSPDAVGRIVIDPAEVSITAHVFKRNELGKFFVDPNTHEIGSDWQHYRVST